MVRTQLVPNNNAKMLVLVTYFPVLLKCMYMYHLLAVVDYRYYNYIKRNKHYNRNDQNAKSKY